MESNLVFDQINPQHMHFWKIIKNITYVNFQFWKICLHDTLFKKIVKS